MKEMEIIIKLLLVMKVGYIIMISEQKNQSMKCHHTSPRIKKVKTQHSARKLQLTVFWD